jgi:drug/metabolite transporter (DMT)-like permease
MEAAPPSDRSPVQTDIAPQARVTRMGAGAVLVAVSGWALTNILLKVTRASALTFAFYRLWLGAAVMLVTLALIRRRPTWRMILLSAPGGVLFGLDVAVFFSALKSTGVADVLVIQALQPALILLVAGPMFGERITGHDVGWTLASVGGVALVTVGTSGTPVWSLRGDLLAVAALILWTAYFLVSKRARREVPATEYMTTVTVTAALVLTPMATLSGQSLGLRWQDWAWLGLFLVAAQGGHVLLAWAHAHVDVSISSLLMLVQPIIAVAAATLILGEPLPALALVGGLVVIASVAVIVRRAASLSAEPRPHPSAV